MCALSVSFSRSLLSFSLSFSLSGSVPSNHYEELCFWNKLQPCENKKAQIVMITLLMFLFPELSVAGGIRGGDHLAGISERLVAIMKNYVSAERYFPVGEYCITMQTAL